MEMTPAYAAETADVLSSHGYTCDIDTEERRHDNDPVFTATRYRLSAPAQTLVLEVIIYPDDEVRYFLEISDYHGLSSYSFELDSWKHRDGYIEFRYYTHPETGGALTLKIQYPDSH